MRSFTRDPRSIVRFAPAVRSIEINQIAKQIGMSGRLANNENCFESMIRGKRVALLGPADYVRAELDASHGRYIDGFDTVIRLNGMLQMESPKLREKYGSKTDCKQQFSHYKRLKMNYIPPGLMH